MSYFQITISRNGHLIALLKTAKTGDEKSSAKFTVEASNLRGENDKEQSPY